MTNNKNTMTAAEWDTAARVVAAHADTLRAMSSHSELFTFAKEHGLGESGSLFAKFKSELRKQLHIDYEALRERVVAERLAAMAAAAGTQDTTVIELCAAGDVEVDSFAVCTEEGADPWYGTFFANENVADQDAADVAAAAKAVWLAGQARESAGLDLVVLRLTVSNHRVTRDELVKASLRARVWVEIEVADQGSANPALEWCRAPGYRGWREVALGDLIATGSEQ